MDSSASPEMSNSANCDEGMEAERDDGGSPSSGCKRKQSTKKAFQPKKKKVVNIAPRSYVWDHYTKTVENIDKCKCHYCGRIMGCASSSGTSSLKKHLRACKTYNVWLETKTQDQHVLNTEGDDRKITLAKVDGSVIREATNEMIVLAELPLAFVESLVWRHFCNKIKLPKPHSRRTATREIVKMFVRQKAQMRKLIAANKQRVSLTTDIWVAPTTASSYMVITAHFIDSSWRLRKLIIGFKNIADHKGATICVVLHDCLAEWGIDKVFTITVDNATANTSALKMFKEGFRVLAHDLKFW